MKKILVAGAALAALAAAGSAHAVTYPSVGNNTAGPSLIISINSSGVASIANGPSSGPYDGVEDTYIGVENNYGKAISSLHLSAPGTDLFGFDGDGIDGYGGISKVAGNPDTTGYGGPISYFTNIAGTLDSGDVNFFGGLASGGFTYFSLEEPLTLASFSVPGGGVTTGGVPEPATWAMMMVGIGAMGAMLRNSTRKNAVTA